MPKNFEKIVAQTPSQIIGQQMEKKSKERVDILAGLSKHDKELFETKLDLQRLLARLERTTGSGADKIKEQIEEVQMDLGEMSGYEDQPAIDRYLALGVEYKELEGQFSQACDKEKNGPRKIQRT